ncbi:PilW family protein [Winogradskya humida]|uniref:Pilin/secretion family protein with methylation motif n=1 Tax=Winogradskya humida TaxID=113566 RepID=A0ABQ3ZNR8_9ACTN|nr:hypothetical protein [Actinoplanes humidus]GIE20239.1 hypothetical protein Ahu01nite_033410 [Actinoplanes humidus]
MRKASDAGFTLVDVIVSSTVMMVVLTIFTTSILSMYRSANSIERKSVAQSQLGIALQRLDREVRYARGISTTPATGATTIDFLSVQNLKDECVQLRVQAGVLSQRTWAYGESPIRPTAWQPLASGIVSTAPFTYVGPTERLGYQQLAIDLKTDADQEQATFTALNTSRNSGNDYCAAGR